MKKSLPVLLFSLVFLSPSYGQKKDPIDVAMEASMTKNSSTAGMVDAIDNAFVQWDIKLNISYKGLQAKLPAN